MGKKQGALLVLRNGMVGESAQSGNKWGSIVDSL